MYKSTIISKLSQGLSGEELSLFQEAAAIVEEVDGKSIATILTELRESGIDGYKAILESTEEDEDVEETEEVDEEEVEEEEEVEDVEEGFDFSKLKKKGSKDDSKEKEDDSEDEEDDSEDEDEEDKKPVKEACKKKVKESYSETVKSRIEEIGKIDAKYSSIEEVSVTEDVTAMFAGEELTEDFKAKATLIFEAAVARQVDAYKTLVEEAIDDIVEEEVETVSEELTEKIDKYLDYVVEEWMKENELAIETGVRNEITEGFIAGLKNLFIESYIEIPEGKEDILAKVSEEKVEIEEEFESAIQKNIELIAEIKDLKKGIIVSEISKGLADTQIEKLESLVESVDFENATDFTKKVSQIKESYFSHKDAPVVESVSIDEGELFVKKENVIVSDKKMSSYVDAVSKFIK
jgi:AcrR family transcriptional regulator